MSTKRIFKLVGLNLGIAVLNIVLFSPGLVGIKMLGAGAFETAFGGTAVFMSLAAFITGNYILLMGKDKMIKVSEISNVEDCINSLKQAYGKKTFDNDISIILEQIERLGNKKETIRKVLLQKFNAMDIRYEKFNGSILDVEFVFFTNIKSILNKVNAFDEDEFRRVKNYEMEKKFSKEVINTKLSIYNEYLSYVKNAIEDNEQIILKLDKLLLEISKINSLEDGEIENMDEIKEIDDLIKKSKYY